MLNFSANEPFSRVFGLQTLLGQDCALCRARSDAAVVCAACERSLPVAGEPLSPSGCDETRAAFAYCFPLDSLVHRFKYAGDLAIGHWLGQRLADRVCRAPRPGLLVAPPMSHMRLRERGFNQAHELACTVGGRLRIPVSHWGLIRVHETRPQPGLGREARLLNLAGAFKVDRDLAGKHVAVVDDVLTTGATAQSLALALNAAGAARVDVWVAALAPQPGTGA